MQSQTVLESARKDLGQVVSQAQKELTKLTAEPEDAESSSAVPDTTEGSPNSNVEGVALSSLDVAGIADL